MIPIVEDYNVSRKAPWFLPREVKSAPVELSILRNFLGIDSYFREEEILKISFLLHGNNFFSLSLGDESTLNMELFSALNIESVLENFYNYLRKHKPEFEISGRNDKLQCSFSCRLKVSDDDRLVLTHIHIEKPPF